MQDNRKTPLNNVSLCSSWSRNNSLSQLQLAAKSVAYYIWQRRRYMHSFVCLKRVYRLGWNVACRQMSGTWMNWLTFKTDPDYRPDAGTGLLYPLSYKLHYTKLSSGKIPRIRIGAAWRCSDACFKNGFIQSPIETTSSEVHALHRVPHSCCLQPVPLLSVL